MTVQIVEKGADTYHGHCGECGCRFTYQRTDVHHNYVQGGARVSCPHCGQQLHHFGASGTKWPYSFGGSR